MKDIKITDVRSQPGDSAFLIDDGKTSVLYDTGFGFTGYDVAENIRKILCERKLDYIFLTHSHYDHALGSAYILEKYPQAKVVAGRYAAGIFTREGAKAVMKDLDNKFAAKCGVTEYEFLGDKLRVDIPCDDGDIIKAGDMTFEVLDLPGHTKCSVGFYCKEHSLLLSTETIGVYDGVTNIVPSYLVGYEMSLRSIDRVTALPIEQLLAPHFGILNREQTDYFLKNARRCSVEAAELILSCLKSGKNDEDIIDVFKEKYWKGYIKDIYPIDAMKLNTSIMIGLIRKELL